MRGDTPAIVLPGEDEPTKLKTPPSVCTICGGKFIRTDRRQKYCPDCRKEVYSRKSLSKKKREKDLAYAFGEKADDDKEDHVEDGKEKTTGGSPSSEVVTYIDETKKRQRAANKKENDMKQDDLEWKHEGPVLAKVKETIETKDGLTLEAELTEAAKKLKAEIETIRIQKEERKRMLAGMIRAIESEFGVRLIDASDLMPVKLEVDGQTYSGIWVRRQDWMGGDDNDQD